MKSLTNRKPKILFLYSELAGYFLACADNLASIQEVEVHIVSWPVNKEAPFQFEVSKKIKHYWKDDFDSAGLVELVRNIAPDFIYCSGRLDKDYMKICKAYKGAIPTVMGLDTKWKGGVKQYAAALLSPMLIGNYFSHAWVPGKSQWKYARTLGFKKNSILNGFYSGDFELFYSYHQETNKLKEQAFPKRFIYVGRYVGHKGVKELWRAFIELQDNNPNEWELWCLGAGDLAEDAMQHHKITHCGFVQPAQMLDYIRQTGVFVLPSRFEPWGVALHEFAAAGYPLICSDEVGAAEAFIEQGVNGILHKAGDVNSLKAAMSRMMGKTDNELLLMGKRSIELAQKITPEKWAKTLISIL